MGRTLYNKAISGTSIVQIATPDSSFTARHAQYPTYVTGAYFVIDAGINDTALTTYVPIFTNDIDTLILNRGWPANHIIICSPPYSPIRLADSVYVAYDKTVATNLGCIFVDIFHAMKDIYFTNPGIVASDSLHPATGGHSVIEQNILRQLPPFYLAGNITAGGNDTTHLNKITNGTTLNLGTTYPIGGITDSLNNVPIKIIEAQSSITGDSSGFMFTPSFNSGASTIYDSILFQAIRTACKTDGEYRHQGLLCPSPQPLGTRQMRL